MRSRTIILTIICFIASNAGAQRILKDYTRTENLTGQVKSIDHRIYKVRKKDSGYVRVPYLQDIYSRSYSEYDSLGRCILSTYYHPESLHCNIHYLYDAQGLLKKQIIEFPADGKTVETIYETNSKGWVTKEIATYADGSSGGSYSFEYDKFGNYTVYSNMRTAPDEFSFQFSGDERFIDSLKRDGKGRLMEKWSYSGNGNLEYHKTYTYTKDSLGRTMKTTRNIDSDYDSFWSKKDFLTIEILNEEGRVLESYYRHKDSTFRPAYHLKTRIEYDSDGEITEEMAYDKGKKVRHEYVRENGRKTEYWDKSGYRVWEMKSTDSLTTIFSTTRDNKTTSYTSRKEIDVDDLGNWTEVRTYDSDKLVSVEERVIVYY